MFTFLSFVEKMNNNWLLSSLFLTLSSMAPAQDFYTVTVENKSDLQLTAQPVIVDLRNEDLPIVTSAIVQLSGAHTSQSEPQEEVPCQLDDLDGDKRFDELCFLTNLKPREKKTFSVTLNTMSAPLFYEPQVYAEMLLKNKDIKEENKQNLYISSLTVEKGTNPYWQLHHHGPAFENKLVAYRIYFDHRQTVDIYGKYHQGLELRDTQFYPDSLQKASGYGDDVLWVGSTLGLGTLRGWNGKEPVMLEDVEHRTLRILAQGPLRTIVEVIDEGWNAKSSKLKTQSIMPITMTTRYTLYAGRRDCMVDVSFDRPAVGYQFCTGVINVKNSVEYSDHEGLRGCWGTDWPVSAKDSAGHKRETVGLGICIPRRYVADELPKDKRNYPFVVGTPDDELHYAISFTSDNEDFGYHSADDWFAWLQAWKRRLNAEVAVQVAPKR